MRVSGEQATILRSLKGAPATVLMALALTGVGLTNEELQLVTGYSDKPLSRGLALLELLGLVRHAGHREGWRLADGVRQLALFPSALLGREMGEGTVIDGVSTAANVRNISELSPSSSSKDLDPDPGILEEEEKGADLRNVSELSPVPVDNSVDNSAKVFAWLRKAGIGRQSPKMRELVALGRDPEAVKAHVLEFLWWQREARRRGLGRPGADHVAGRARFSVGTLIRILEDGDPPPPMRCERCLERNCYCEVVKR